MEINIIKTGQIDIAEVFSDKIFINNVQDALDLMANCQYKGADKIILLEKNFSPDFFDLKTRLAGEILQKFSNYRVQLAIVGDFTKYSSKSLQDFIRESNKQKHIVFTGSNEEARKILSR